MSRRGRVSTCAACDATRVTRERRAPSTLGSALRRILCIAAHPDDLEFTVSGSVARWMREGRDATFCLVTTGGAGTNEHTPSSEGLLPIRERESREAARILGVTEGIFLGYQGGGRRADDRPPRRAHALHPSLSPGRRRVRRSDGSLLRQRVPEPPRSPSRGQRGARRRVSDKIG